MKNSQKNEIIRGKCIDISQDGKGIIKNGRDIIFCDGLFLDEEADVEILYSRAGVLFGKVKKLYSLSKDRIQPKCKICSSCGGCQYQQLKYDAQLHFKTNRVKNALKYIGKIDCDVLPCIGMDDPYYYRNKIQMPYGKDKKGNVYYGFYRQNTHEIIPIKECCIENKKAASILWDIKDLIKKHGIIIFNEDSGKGVLRYVLIRTSYHYDELMVVLVVSRINFPGQRNFINDLTKIHPEITSVVANENPRFTNVILGEKEKVLFGKSKIKDSILGLTFEISASSFYQVNPIQVEVLYSKALDLIDIKKEQVVLDAYAGVGTIGMIASKNAKKVISVEINESAHKNAIENAKRNNITNMEFYCDDAGKFITNYEGQIDIVIMDPPRKGSDHAFISSVMGMNINNVIYISCDPETLARDLNEFSSKYEVRYVQPVDMFPMTSHVECITLLCRK
ncbi:MAG: 23S rRNA (uracil(1939)-C(5))-methyltransferase RlmD [Bacillales bacterium]|nr:23S rRNA (uracil(1939)-C(5))-methyltransferase RlmD [Bacillales bacterium]